MCMSDRKKDVLSENLEISEIIGFILSLRNL